MSANRKLLDRDDPTGTTRAISTRSWILYAEDAVPTNAGRHLRGADAIRERLAQELNGFTGSSPTEWRSYIEQANAFAELMSDLCGTHTGSFCSCRTAVKRPPTGKRVEIKGMEFVQLRDGKIVDNQPPHDGRRGPVRPRRGDTNGATKAMFEVAARLKVPRRRTRRIQAGGGRDEADPREGHEDPPLRLVPQQRRHRGRGSRGLRGLDGLFEHAHNVKTLGRAVQRLRL